MKTRIIMAWKLVVKKWTFMSNAVLAAGALTYPVVAVMKDDLSPWIVSSLAGMAALNVYLGNLRQKNLPPP